MEYQTSSEVEYVFEPQRTSGGRYLKYNRMQRLQR